MFEALTLAPADPILGLAELFNTDQRANKINLGIGIYLNETGQTPILRSVKQAEHYLLQHESSKNYLPIEGTALFARYTQELLFGQHSALIQQKRVHTAQTPGGTGALRVIADFIAQETPIRRIWISRPSWPNHQKIFQALGFEICEYPYYDAKEHALDFEGMFKRLQEAKKGDIVLLHGCCHNPTGVDPSLEQWKVLAQLSLKNGWLPLFDVAYQGFGHGLEEDVQGLRAFTELLPELLVASSYSKNFGLYNERVGACTLIAANADIAERAFSQIKNAIRGHYSNPPAHGAAIVCTILSNPELRQLWENELTEMRQHIQHMRHDLVQTLADKGSQQDFSFINRQNGMFSFSGLTKEQVLHLREHYAIYAVDSGRINVAGISPTNLEPLCNAIIDVLR